MFMLKVVVTVSPFPRYLLIYNYIVNSYIYIARITQDDIINCRREQGNLTGEKFVFAVLPINIVTYGGICNKILSKI